MDIVAPGHPLLSLRHEFHEVIEKIVRIVRSGRGFRMILHAEDRVAAMAEALQGLIVEIHVRDLHLVEIERIRVHRETVIVRRDLDLAGDLVDYGVIGAAMSELELVRLASDGQAEKLMAETDAEDRRLADELADVRDF